jgi:uncharacterized delta-60 repeat protein
MPDKAMPHQADWKNVVKETIKKSTACLQNLVPKAVWLKLGLALLIGFAASTGKSQTNFASAQVLSGDWGIVTNNNTGATPNTGAPSNDGFAPNAPLWYQWTAPQDGVVEMDTIGSSIFITNLIPTGAFDTNTFQPLFVTNISPVNIDTVMGVYTGTNLTALNQVAANDNLFPINNFSSSQTVSTAQFTESGNADFNQYEGFEPGETFLEEYIQPFYGPSGLRFNAKGGQTYYIAVDTKRQPALSVSPGTGPITLSWAYKPSGVFRFASEDVDPLTGMLLYQTSETESQLPEGTSIAGNSTILTYYNYNAPGVLVTVTRVAGSTGRAMVNYTTIDGTNLPVVSPNDMPAFGEVTTNFVTGTNFMGNAVTNTVVATADYTAVSGTLVFDDFEMSKTILIPIINRGRVAGDQANRVFGIQLSSPTLDPLESADVSQPRVDATFSTAMVRILNVNADPYGPDLVPQVVTNITMTATNVMTNMVIAAYPTNVVFNFEKANYRVPADVNNPTVSPWTQVTLWVERYGTNGAAATLNYRVNNYLGSDADGDEEQNIKFPLQPGSDYAVPTPANQSPIRGTNSDFVLAQGTVNFPSTGAGSEYQPITFTVPTSSLTKFNKDFKVQIYHEANFNNQTVPYLVGMVNEATVTILFNDQNPPAGSVDEFYNADFNSQLALYSSQVPSTTPPNDANPGVGLFGEVYSVAILTNNEAFIGGDFQSYNGSAQSSVALVNTNGSLDASFNPGSGANAAVNAVAISGNQFFVGGSFTSFNGNLVGRIARLNANGSLDTSFNPGLGADGTVRTIAMLSNGEVLIGGDFTHINGTACNYIALLNTNGVLDTSFNPGNNLMGPVYTMALYGNQIMVGGNFAVNGQIYQNIVRLNLNGSIDNTFNPGTGADNVVHTLAVQVEGQIIIGGEFTHVNGTALNRIARLNPNGSIDSTNFYVGTGADATVFSINANTATNITGTNVTSSIYVGGSFASFNGTHRLGFARLYPNGTVDTTFMDTAYNQFAGLKRIYSYDAPAILASAVQSDGNILIGGSFDQVGGGQANTNVCNTLDDEEYITESFDDTNLWVEPKTRDGVRNRSGLARLIGGATPGPGNIGLNQTSYSANKSQSSLTVSLVRTNGTLGPVSANFSVQPNLAQSGRDYTYDSAPPLYWVDSQYLTHPSRERSDGLFGQSGFLIDPYGLSLTLADALINNLSDVTVSIINNKLTSGNLNAQFQLANPSVADTFYLGAEEIPVGAALGVPSSPFTLVDDTSSPGTFGFSSSTFIATNLNPTISVVRSNGTFGVVSMKYSTTNGTAVVGTDYVGITNQNLIFAQNVLSNGFNVTVKNIGLIYTNIVEKTVNLQLFGLGTTPGATFGISNAVLRIIDPNYQGYVTLGATNYTSAISSGTLPFVVNRVSGSLGSVTVQYATTNGSAVNGVDYVGSTNTLSWVSGDVSPRTVSIPLLNSGIVGTNKQFGVRLFNPMLNNASTPALMAGLITNATLTISNDNNYGTIQFAAPSYIVNENGSNATLTVVRTGGAVGTVSVNYAASNGANTASGVNYVATSGVLILGPNQSSASFTVPILDDGVVDPANFYFNVTLSNPTNAVLGSPTNAQVNLLDVESYNRPPGSPDTAFNTNGMNGDVFALALQSNGQIMAGGNFTAVGPVSENSIARLNTDGSLDTTFLNGLSGANAAVNAIASQTDDRIVVGGAFTTIDGVQRNFIARLMTDGTLDTSFNPGSGADNTVNAVAEIFAINGTNVTRELYIGGAFDAVNGTSSPGIIRLNNDGTVDSGFNAGSGVDGQIYAIAAYPTNSIYAGKVLIGGSFAHYNGSAINNLARLNANGSLDTNFTANFGSGPNGIVHALAIQTGGQVLVGGNFTSFNGMALNRIARLNTDGTLDANFVAAVGAGANSAIEGIVLQPDNRIVLIGQFTQANGVTRNHITRLLPTGATDPAINFGDGANGDVDAIVLQPANEMLVIGGAFSQYDDQLTAGIARIYGGSETGSGAFEFTSANFQADEKGVEAAITIRRTGGTSGPNPDGSGNVLVNFATSDGTAVAGVNYNSVNVNVSFPPGEVLETVLVPVLDDMVITPNLTVNLALSNPTPPAGITNQPNATLTIVNDDNAVAFSSAFYTQTKNTPTGVAVIDVLRLGGTNNTSSVDFYTTTNGTAIVGTDYYPTNATLTFNPGQSDVQIQVPIINNNLAEGNKTISLLLTNAVNTTLTSPSNATLTVIDTVSAPGQLYFSATNFVANSGDGTAFLTVLRTNGSSGSVSVTYNTIAGTAQPGLNYVAATGTLTFSSGSTTENVPIQLVNNNIVQGPVSLSVILSNPTGGATLTAPTNTTLTILNTNIGFAFVNATNYVRETNGAVPIFVQRLGSTVGGVQVNYSTTAGTALPGVNYSAVSGTLTFGSGEMLQAISLPLIYDPQVTGNLNLTMQLSSPSANTVLGSPSNTVVVIQDADAGFSFTNSATSVLKNAGNAIITVICSNPSVEPVVNSNTIPLSVQYATADGTATAGIDYTATSGRLIFTNGIGTNTFIVPIINNNSTVTGNRAFTVALSNPTPPGQLVAPSTQTVTIIDSNSGLKFSSPNYTVLKTNVAATINVFRTGFTDSVVSVDFIATNGTATAGLNFIATNGTLVFTNGVTNQTFSVNVIDTTATQPNLTVLLQLLNPTNDILATPSAATLTILDNTGSYVIPAGAALVSETGAGAPNGIIDSNETVQVLFAFRDAGFLNVTNLIATLLPINGVTSPSGSKTYGPLIAESHSVSQPFTFTAHGTNGQNIVPTFQLYDNAKPIGTNTFTFTLGSWTTLFTNAAPIVINDNAAASPYPSPISVSGVGGSLIKATVTVTNMNHSRASDIAMLVVSPTVQDTLIMANAGGSHAVSQVTITFDDAATNSPLPQTGQIISGTNEPTAYLPVLKFP